MDAKFRGKDPEDIFRGIYSKCQKCGISPSQISKLSSVRRLDEKKGKGGRWWWSSHRLRWGIATLGVILFGVAFHLGLHTKEGFTKVWFYLNDFSLEREICTIPMPSEVQNFFMPPVDCSLCENLTHIEKVYNISPEDFEKRFAYSAVPVVISDGTRNWTAPQVFSFDFFKKLYLGTDEAHGFEWDTERECQFFPYQTEFTSLVHVLTMNSHRARMEEGSKPWYIGWSNCDSKLGNILRTHYTKPYFLPPQSESTNIDWIFMGTPGYGAHMHIDRVNNPSWQAQIKGRKRWTLEPAPECYSICTILEVTVEPGEIIVLDTNVWYHKTLIVGDELSITIGSEYD